MGLPTDGDVKGGYQVFLQADTRQIDKHVEALTYLPEYIFDKWERILHPFAGLGVTAQVIDQSRQARGLAPIQHIMWERDEECVKYLQSRSYNAAKVVDSYKSLGEANLAAYDAIMFDPTAGTIKTPGMVPFWKRAAQARVPLVWVTDSACSKIWLHREHYIPELDRRVEDATDYLRAYNTMLNHLGYVIVAAWREPTVTYFVAVRDVNYAPFEEIKVL